MLSIEIKNECVSVPNSSAGTLETVLSYLRTAFPSSHVIGLQYTDEDGDQIDIATNDDFLLWLDEHGQNLADCQLSTVCIEETPSRSCRKENSLDVEDILSIDPQTLKYVDTLGIGASGTVYQVVDLSNDRIMAIKSISLDVTEDEQEQILSELEILHKCDSQFIIEFYGAFFTPDSRIQICCEYMDGGSLVDKTPISNVTVLAWVAYSAFHGLKYLWDVKILHRDVKPSNILVNTDGDVKLCDFGVSVRLETSIAKTYVGTNAYMAPERLKGDAYGVPADVWSVGMTLLELATGDPPTTALGVDMANPLSMIQHLVKLETVGIFNSKISDEKLRYLIGSCLKLDASDRPSLDSCLNDPFVLSVASAEAKPATAKWINELI